MAAGAAAFPAVACALLALLLAGSAASASGQPQVFVVGGEPRGWRKPAAHNKESYNHWAARNRFHVGDFLHFKYDKNDSVLVVSRDDYRSCGAARPARRFAGGDTRFRLDRVGYCYFISGAPGHCEAGQRMTVRVADRHAADRPAPAEAPAAAPPGSEDEGGAYDPPPPTGSRSGGGGGSASKPGHGGGPGLGSGSGSTASTMPPPRGEAAGAGGGKTSGASAPPSLGGRRVDLQLGAALLLVLAA